MITSSNKYRFLDIFQILSLDVVLGTVAVGYMATRLLYVEANLYWWIILPLSVWFIYSSDHIIDSYKNKGAAVIYRHKFHYLYRKKIIAIMLIAGIVALVLSIRFLDFHIIISGLLLSAFIGLYFILIIIYNKKKTVFLQKELIIAMVYSFGIFLAPVYWHGSLPSFSVILVIFIVFMLAWFEGIMISWFDYNDDIEDGHTSFTVVVGRKNTRRFLIIGHAFIELIIILGLISFFGSIVFWALLILLIMNFIIALLVMYPLSHISTNYFKLIGETVFWLPGLLFFL